MPTIDEAYTVIANEIEIAKLHNHSWEVKCFRLGIEALKRVKDNRTHCLLIVYQPLPGETEEAKADLQMISKEPKKC